MARELDYPEFITIMISSRAAGGSMNSDDLRERLLAAELAHLKNEVVTQLCRWHRCRSDHDLLMALRNVEELVAIEDGRA